MKTKMFSTEFMKNILNIKNVFGVFIISVAFASCSTTGQVSKTPDDLYYSSADRQQSNEDHVNQYDTKPVVQEQQQEYVQDNTIRIMIQILITQLRVQKTKTEILTSLIITMEEQVMFTTTTIITIQEIFVTGILLITDTIITAIYTVVLIGIITVLLTTHIIQVDFLFQ